METRRLFVAMFAAFAVYMIYNVIYFKYWAPSHPAHSAAQSQPAEPPQTASATATTQAASVPSTGPASQFAFQAFDARELTLGGRENDALRLQLNSRGAAVDTIELTERREDGRYVHRAEPEGNDPYRVVQPVSDDQGPHRSFVTRRLWLSIDGRDYDWTLEALDWRVIESDAEHAVFGTTLHAEDGGDLLAITKTYRLRENKPLVDLDLSVQNLSDRSFKLTVEQDAATGIPKEHIQYDMRWLSVGHRASGGDVAIGSNSHVQGGSLIKPGDHLLYSPKDQVQFVWTALSNKYFAVVTRPIPDPTTNIAPIEKVFGVLAAPDAAGSKRGDLLAEMRTTPRDVNPGESAKFDFQIYAGAKSHDHLADVDPAFVDRHQLGYVALRDADQRCCCTFGWLTDLIIALMNAIHTIVPNYGISIIILVLIIKTLLHPLSVYQQKSMFRAQEGMAHLQPKMADIRERYANDKVRLNQEMMKLYSEEGVNPAAPMISMIPMFIQMPILIAMYTAVNTNINLRHAPFDGWWINDLSSPDALVSFAHGLTIPVLSWLPFIGSWFVDIPSLNVLPILMGVAMWLQQKYMPKPHMEAKLEAARNAQVEGKKPAAGPAGMNVEDQIRQQAMMANVMAVMFPIMLYYMPAGLNLYWMATNVFGIFESIRVRKQIRIEKERRKLEGPKPKADKQPGVVAKFFKKLAQQAEEIQKQADNMSDRGRGGSRTVTRKDKNKR